MLFIAAMLFAVLAPAPLSYAQEEKSEELAMSKRFVTIDFDSVDMAVFIKYMSELTGKNFVIEETVKGKVTIVSPSKISVEEAYKVFQSVLEVHGYTTIPSGSIIKIIPAVDARTKNIETLMNEAAKSPEDKVVTRLIPLKYASTEELKKIFTPLVSKNSIIVSYDPTRTLIITDVLSNINRLLKIIDTVDQPVSDQQLSLVALKHAGADEMAKSILSIFHGAPKPDKQDPGGIKIVPDVRTNTLIIMAPAEEMTKIKDLIATLDREIPRGEGDIRVYYLENANAEELAKVLTALPGKEAAPGGPPGGEKGVLPTLGKNIKIVADKASNSLIITAPKDDYLVLEEVIRKLDIARKMVYLEALIMEVTLTKNFDLGFQWTAPRAFNINNSKYGVLGGYVDDNAGFSDYPGTNIPTGLSLGIMGPTIKIGDVIFPSLKAVFNAFKNDSDINIISAPQILTTDNEEAQIKVGQNIPYQTRDAKATDQSTYTNYEYKDVGTTLKITPQINQAGVVRLKVFQQIMDVVSSDNFRPTTQTRSAETTVIVKDKNTVVLGGIILDNQQSKTNQVPGLSDIPLLGWLFKTNNNHAVKTNLYLFITPHIINNPSEVTKVFETKRDAIEDITRGPSPILQQMTSEQDAGPLVTQGLTAMESRDYAKARKYFQRAHLADPNAPPALFYLAQTLEHEGDRAEAIRLYKRLAVLDTPRSAEISNDPAHGGATFVELATMRLKDLE